MKRRLALVVALVMLFTCLLPTICYAHERQEHDKDLVSVLFSEEFDVKQQPENVQDYIAALSCAVYLAVDQYQGNGQDSLDFLLEQGYLGIPETIEDFDYHTNPSIHRSFTHRGWDHTYIDDKARWNIRKNLLIEVVNQVFDFGAESKIKINQKQERKTKMSNAVGTKNMIEEDTVAFYKHVYEDIVSISVDADSFGLFDQITDEDVEKCKWIAEILEVMNDVPRRRMEHIFKYKGIEYDSEEFLEEQYPEEYELIEE